MKAYDFEYDGITLSSLGYMICQFGGSNGANTISNGSQITFNTVSTYSGKKQVLTDIQYEECIQTTFQICKDQCDGNDPIMSYKDIRKISRWLNRTEYKKFKLINDEMINYYFEASFNISRIEFGGEVIGLELNMFTNSPFALMDNKIVINSTANNTTVKFYDKSDVEGYIYPKMKIIINSDGNLKIKNAIEDRTMLISNCKSGEIITIDYPVIQSSLASHKIQNDFNWNYFRFANSFMNNLNEITVSIPCKIEMTYPSYVKLSV